MPIRELVLRSEAFDLALRGILADAPIPDSPRDHIAHALGVLSMDCSHGIRTLILAENETAAFALLRPQFEGKVRMAWVRYAAPEGWMDAFASEVVDQLREPASFYRIEDMLDGLDANAPAYLAAALRAMKTDAWDAMNSYTHGGLRAINRVLIGIDPELVEEVVKVSNGILLNTAMAMAENCRQYDLSPRLYEAADRAGDLFMGQRKSLEELLREAGATREPD